MIFIDTSLIWHYNIFTSYKNCISVSLDHQKKVWSSFFKNSQILSYSILPYFQIWRNTKNSTTSTAEHVRLCSCRKFKPNMQRNCQKRMFKGSWRNGMYWVFRGCKMMPLVVSYQINLLRPLLNQRGHITVQLFKIIPELAISDFSFV